MRLPLIEQAAKAARNEQEPPGQECPLCRDRVCPLCANTRRTVAQIRESEASNPLLRALLETPPRRPPRWTIHAAAIELRTALGARGAGSRCLSRSVRMY